MSDDIRALTAEVASDPSSLAFLDLAEALRLRGQLEVAEKVALNGLSRYPHLPAAHDMYARVLADRGNFQHAFDEWDMTVRLEPRHLGALKGLGFLYYQAGDHGQALHHLEAAWREAPTDEGLHGAIVRLRELLSEAREAPPALDAAPSGEPDQLPEPAPAAGAITPFGGADSQPGQRLLIGGGGLCLAGTMVTWTGESVTERAASETEGVVHEALRTADRVGLGTWRSLIIETDGMNACLLAPTPRTILLEVQEREQPIGQIMLTAERAARGARIWLGEIG
jgi:tetratricopeptide (TPR) repeat protein